MPDFDLRPSAPSTSPVAAQRWPALDAAALRDTWDTVHMWTQVVGKIRLATMPMTNQWWQVPLYVTTRGLGTRPMPFRDRTFEIDFDFFDHELVVRTSDGAVRAVPLLARSVRELHAELFETLRALGISPSIWTTPVEVPDPIPFERDDRHHAYDPAGMRRYFDVLRRVAIAFERFRARFAGKSSPVHFFWGSFDFCVTRFSGRPAPPRAGADRITRLAYDQEASSVGFWPGSGPIAEPAFYAYHAPEPEGFARARVVPRDARYDASLGEFLLPYDAVRRSREPEAMILAFAESAYAAGAELAGWDRRALEARFT